MTKIKFEIEIDAASTPDEKLLPQLNAIGALVQTVAGKSFVNAEAFNQEKSKKPRKRRTKAQIEADEKAKAAQEEAPASEEKQEEAPASEEKQEESDEQRLITLRALLSKTIQWGGDDARDKCVAKLQEMDAKNPDTGKYNISSLDSSKYGEFTEFLNSL